MVYFLQEDPKLKPVFQDSLYTSTSARRWSSKSPALARRVCGRRLTAGRRQGRGSSAPWSRRTTAAPVDLIVASKAIVVAVVVAIVVAVVVIIIIVVAAAAATAAAAAAVSVVVVVIFNAFAAAVAIAVAVAVAAATTIADTAAVVDCYVFSPPRSISMEPFEGDITHDPINARHRLEPAPEGQRQR
jgi:hypothetical protein